MAFDPPALRYRGPSHDRAFALFSSLGFRTLVADYAPTAKTSHRDYGVIASLEEIDALVRDIRAAGRVGIAAIGSGESAVRAAIVGWAFSVATGHGRYVPLAHSGLADTPNLPAREVFARLGPVLADRGIAKVGHDLKFATIAAAREGVTLAGADLDTLIVSYLLDATRSSHDLAGLSLERASYRAMTEEDVTGKGAKARALDAVPPGSLAAYAGERADLPLGLAPGLVEDLRQAGLETLYEEYERPLIPVLAEIEQAGIKVDTAALGALGSTMQVELDDLGEADLRTRRLRVQHQLAEAALRRPVRAPRPAGRQEDRQDPRGLDRPGRARGTGADARACPVSC